MSLHICDLTHDLSSHEIQVGKVELVTVNPVTLLRTLGPREEGCHSESVAGVTLPIQGLSSPCTTLLILRRMKLLRPFPSSPLRWSLPSTLQGLARDVGIG